MPPTIIIVDPDPAVRASLSFSLGLEGFAVEEFADREALLAGDAAARADCLVIDHRVGSNGGLSLLQEVRRRGVSKPAIILTSNPSRATAKAIGEAGARLVEKPLLCDALLAALRDAVNPAVHAA